MVITHEFFVFFFVCPFWRISYKTGAVSVLLSAVSSCAGTIQKYSANIYGVPTECQGLQSVLRLQGEQNSDFRECRLESRRCTVITRSHSFIIRLKLPKKKRGMLWNSWRRGLTGGGPGWKASPKKGCPSRCLKMSQINWTGPCEGRGLRGDMVLGRVSSWEKGPRGLSVCFLSSFSV